MTTYNHTLIALSAAALTEDLPIPVKIAALGALAVIHLPLDGLPYPHWYDADKIKDLRSMFGCFVELVGGLFILPLVIGLVFQMNLFWLGLCVVSASGVDFLVFFKIPQIVVLNHRCHFWYKLVSPKMRWVWEGLETSVLTCLMIFVLHYFHHVA